MKKIYLVITLAATTITAKAQLCDTINMPVPSNWSMQSYISESLFGSLGYISGINSDNFTIQANFFDLSATSYTYLQGVMVKFTKANSNQDTSFAKPLYFRVYADNNGAPGTEITTDQTRGMALLSGIKSDVGKGNYTGITFPSAITLPSNKKFYVAVDMSNFKWFSPESHYDSICIATTADNETTNTAWNFDADPLRWRSYTRTWPTPPDDMEALDVTLYIFPYVSTSQSGCTVLPVTLTAFTAEKKAADVLLKWQVADEINMKGYEVEKAAGNNIFRSIAFVAAHNDRKATQYSLVDANAFAASTTLQYRIKQIDGDGKVEYSTITRLNNNKQVMSFANPFTGTLTLQLNIPSAQSVTISLFDAQGKTLLVQQPVVYSTATVTRLNGTESLKPGTYFLNIMIDNKQYAYKVLKQ